jgi:tryptophan synthase alpha subunit
VADAVVIGSRIIEEIEGGARAPGAARRVTKFLSGVRAAMDGEKP